MVNKSFDMGGFVSVLISQDIANFNFKLIINYCKTNYNIMWKDKGLQLVMLPTKEKSLLWSHKGRTLRYNEANFNDVEDEERYYLYLLSDEEIKEGDWCIMLDDFGHVFSNPQHYTNPITQHLNKGLRKVIVCLDPSLNLPSFSDSFLEEYVKRYNSKQTMEVEVEYRLNSDTGNNVAEWEELVLNRGNTISIRFKEEKMYSEKEVFDIYKNYQQYLITNDNVCMDLIGWFKENLK